MRIQVHLFANLADYQPRPMSGGPTTVELPEGSTVGDLARQLAIPPEVPRLTLVNGRDATPGVQLRPGDVVSLLPPLVGGSDALHDPRFLGSLYRSVLRIRHVAANIARLRMEAVAVAVWPFVGAMLLALGVVAGWPELSRWLPRVFGLR